MTQEIEILRGDLSRVFYDATKEQTEYRFGVSVTAVRNQPDTISVDFTDGSTEVYDLVVAAEGVGSATRKLVMDECVSLKYLGFYTAYFRIPKLPGAVSWARWYNAVGGLVILMRPSTAASESVCVDFRSDDRAVDRQSLDTRREMIRKALRGVGFEGARISENLDYDDDLYLGPLMQVKASRWSVGRFVLVGDAAYGPSAVTGMGTTLAITGAYVLAGELAKHTSHLAALASYAQILRPLIDKAQRLPPGVPWIAHPKTRLGISVFNAFARAAASKPVQSILRVLTPKSRSMPTEAKSDGFTLPSYEF